MRLRPLATLVTLVALPLLYAVFIAVRARSSGLTWREMDLDHDGTTTLTEVWFVSDHGVRLVTIGGRQCSEIFLLKDGLGVKTICPEARRQ